MASTASAIDVQIAPIGDLVMSRLTKSEALLLFAFVVVAWGVNWTVTKLIVMHVPPLWTAAIRTGIGALTLLAMLAVSQQIKIPKRGDIPVILAISLFHMVAFAALMTTGLKYVPVGRSIVLGYTTSLWVAPGHGCCSRRIYRRGKWLES